MRRLVIVFLLLVFMIIGVPIVYAEEVYIDYDLKILTIFRIPNSNCLSFATKATLDGTLLEIGPICYDLAFTKTVTCHYNATNIRLIYDGREYTGTPNSFTGTANSKDWSDGRYLDHIISGSQTAFTADLTSDENNHKFYLSIIIDLVEGIEPHNSHIYVDGVAMLTNVTPEMETKILELENEVQTLKDQTSLLEITINKILSWLFFSNYEELGVCEMVTQECGLDIRPPPSGDVVIFRTNVVEGNYLSCGPRSNCWIALDFDKDGDLDPMGYNGKYYGCNEGTILLETYEGYKVIDYGDPRRVDVCIPGDKDIAIRFDTRSSVTGVVLDKFPVSPYSENNQEIYE